MRSSRERAPERGFTLVEMLTVVVMVGILATLATYAVRKYILSAKMSEAVSMMSSIKSAEEAYRSETFRYLNVSGNNFGEWYPAATPGAFKTPWGNTTTPAGVNWQTLGVVADGPVMFSYAVTSGGPADPYPTLPTQKALGAFGFPNARSQWYIAVAKGDLDGDGTVFSYVLSHSMSNEIYIENDGN